jgi:hypothetical protein
VSKEYGTNIVTYNNHTFEGELGNRFNQVLPTHSTERITISAASSNNLTSATSAFKYIGVATAGLVDITLPEMYGVFVGKELVINGEVANPNIRVYPPAGRGLNANNIPLVITNGFSSMKLITDGTHWYTQ